MVDIQLFGQTVDSGLFFGTLMALLVICRLIYTAYFDRRKLQQGRKLKDIDRQLTELYLPMENCIREYMETTTAPSFDFRLLDLNKMELKRKLGILETQYPDMIDNKVYNFLRNFFTGEAPIQAFRHAVSIKISDLRKEREKCTE